jgi:hypothetical protein
MAKIAAAQQNLILSCADGATAIGATKKSTVGAPQVIFAWRGNVIEFR